MHPIPAPTDSDLVADVLADRTRRSIYRYVSAQPAPVGVNHVAESFGMHRNAAKFHLDKLLAAGLLEAEFRRINGRKGPGAGRPSKLYFATDAEVSFAIPDRRYELLAKLLLRALTSGESLEAVGRAFGGELARSVRVSSPSCSSDGLRCAELVLEQLGFDPTVERDADGTAWITTQNCPFGRVAIEAPDADVCRLDLAIVQGVLEEFSGTGVEVREHLSMAHGHEVCVRQATGMS